MAVRIANEIMRGVSSGFVMRCANLVKGLAATT